MVSNTKQTIFRVRYWLINQASFAMHRLIGSWDMQKRRRRSYFSDSPYNTVVVNPSHESLQQQQCLLFCQKEKGKEKTSLSLSIFVAYKGMNHAKEINSWIFLHQSFSSLLCCVLGHWHSSLVSESFTSHPICLFLPLLSHVWNVFFFWN